MKKYIVIAVVIILLVGGYLFYKKENVSPMTDDESTPVAATPTTSAAASPSATAGVYKDGIYTSSVIQTDRGYGPVQIKLTISGGKITDVAFVQYPNMPGHTLEVSQQAMPILKQEAITGQGANVDVISGATQTSQAFQQALQNALAMAK